ncbi:MAG: OmpA family protein [Flavobacteriales bacterium]|nr:OmpA family protein [Flavobacteriales bacterium]
MNDKVLTKVLTTIICCAAFALSAQNVTAISQNRGEQESSFSENSVNPDPTEYIRSIDEINQSLLTELINYSLKDLIDRNYFVQNGIARVNFTKAEFNKEATAIVKNAIWINDLPFSDMFQGFSVKVLSEAEELRALNTSLLRTSNPNGQVTPLYQFQSKVFELKRLSINEALEFIEVNISSLESEKDNPRPQLPVEDFEMTSKANAEEGLASLFLDPNLFEDPKNKIRKGRRSRNEFSEQVVKLLEENNRILASYSGIFQSLQSQIDEINSRDNSDLRQDMAEMREMIMELRDNPSSSNREEVDYLIFNKNDYSLSAVQKAMLNKYVVLLAKNPQKDALVIGYADRSGKSDYNVWLSEQRANSVKSFFERMGVASNRIIVSYFGDTESISSGPADRRVEVSLIN